MTSDTGGVTTDTGIRTDTGMRTDAGTTPPATGGCACSVPGPASHGSAPGLLGALALGLTLVIRRRQR
jgi:MYXO-CTERM domain-containing protein